MNHKSVYQSPEDGRGVMLTFPRRAEMDLVGSSNPDAPVIGHIDANDVSSGRDTYKRDPNHQGFGDFYFVHSS